MSQDLVRERRIAQHDADKVARAFTAAFPAPREREPEVGDVVVHWWGRRTGEIVEVTHDRQFKVREIATGELETWPRNLVHFPKPGSRVVARGTIAMRELTGEYIGRSRWRGESLILAGYRVVPVLSVTLQVIEEPHVI
ncbi:hypothetical protein [Amycolatopsis sp.]|uniref:hypothetical protein n=1 Tax=Amycolatopsis sp. TaxID=37632 RepID=UPI002C20EECE|nr:hypothetical protein [Amycolatopsis sp.]HVV11604.1 hypothetical protein [Amycolatopsis sp.]